MPESKKPAPLGWSTCFTHMAGRAERKATRSERQAVFQRAKGTTEAIISVQGSVEVEFVNGQIQRQP